MEHSSYFGKLPFVKRTKFEKMANTTIPLVNLEEPVRVASPHRINLEEPVRVASPHRINLEEPGQGGQPT